jgi:hypothetical protein
MHRIFPAMVLHSNEAKDNLAVKIVLRAVLLSGILILTAGTSLAWFKFKGQGNWFLHYYSTTLLLSPREKRRRTNAHDILEAGKKQKEGKHKTLSILGNLNTSEYSGERNPTEGFVFPTVSFQDITAVTNNFDRSFIIGQGGFGKVYKVIDVLIHFSLQFIRRN